MSDETVTVEQDEQPAMVLVQGEDGVFHRAMLAPDPEPRMGGESEPIVAAIEPLEVVETVPVDAVNLTPEPIADAAPTDPPSPPNPRSGSMMSPEELAEYDSETVRLVSSKESHVCQLEAELADIKSQTKAAKKAVEDAKESLRELIQNRDRQRGRKPAPSLTVAPAHTTTATANRVDEDNATDQVNDDQGDQAATTSEPKPIDPHADLWKVFPVTFERWGEWGLTKKDIERLNSGETKNSGVHPITILGHVTRFITPNPDSPAFTRTLKDFKGFGDAAYDRWLDAETQFWDWWNNKGGKEEFAAQRANELETAL